MSKIKKQKSNTISQQFFETPKDGDWISVSFDEHRNNWWGPLYYRSIFEDKEKGKIEGACVLTESWSESGKLSLLFEQAEFWSVWEGETIKEYEDRKKRIIADLQRNNIPIDPFDSFMGVNAIQGEWSAPKIGPAFKVLPVEGKWTRPKDEDMIEVHPWNYSEAIQGVYFSAADRIYSRNHTIERAILVGEGAGEVKYGDRFHYGVPKLPFSEWVRWRLIGDTVSQWQPGPHFEKWERDEKARILREEVERNIKAFRDWKEWLENQLHTAKSTAECIVILRQELRSEETVPLPNREPYITLLSNKLKHFEEVLIVERSELNSPTKAKLINQSVIVDEDDSTIAAGPYHTVGELAMLTGLSEGGIRKVLRQNKKIFGVTVKYIRNEGMRSTINIADESYKKIKRRVESQT
jgi:hypothetical protein